MIGCCGLYEIHANIKLVVQLGEKLETVYHHIMK